MAITTTAPRIVGADWLSAGKFAWSPRPDPKRLPGSLVRRRVKKLALQRRHRAIDGTLAPAGNTRQRIQGGSAKSFAIRR
jgi:hypothetical protein